MISLSPKDSGIDMPEGEPKVSEEEAMRAHAAEVLCDYATPMLKDLPLPYFQAWRDDFLEDIRGQIDVTYLLVNNLDIGGKV